jgi:hypothetical protein
MSFKTTIGKFRTRWIILFMLLSACVDKIDFSARAPAFQIVVEGMISDEPGPSTVTLSEALPLNADSIYREPIQHASITLYDDAGNSEPFLETTPGVYRTQGILQGRVGHSYHIVIETEDGHTLESKPDIINSVGAIEDIRYEYEARTQTESWGEVPADVFKIFVDASAGSGTEHFVRWRFNGTYKVVTEPELHTTWLQGTSRFLDPPPCSGYIVAPALGGGRLEKVAECTCCACWISQFESMPSVADDKLVSGNRFRNINVGEVPINAFTFFDKYQVMIEQMSLSQQTYEFFKLIRAQKDAAASLFQPPPAEIKGNIHARDAGVSVAGIFWAASVSRRSVFIPKTAVPYLLPPPKFTDSCTKLVNSTNQEPGGWE